MQFNLSIDQIQERNQLIADVLSTAKGKEIHISEIAWLLQLDPHEADCWMRQHGFGKWMNGKTGHWWRGIESSPATTPESF